MKKILISLPNGQVARSILQTKVYKHLIENDGIRIIFVVPSVKINYYKKLYKSKNIEFITYDGGNVKFNDRTEKIWAKFLFHSVNTETVIIKIKRNYFANKNTSNFIKLYLSILVTKIISRSNWVKSLFRKLYFYSLSLDPEILKIADCYKPDLIYAPHIYDYTCNKFIKLGKVRKIKVVATINSWDNLSTRGLIPIIPDKLILHSGYMLDEAVEHHLVDEDILHITGIPHFDYYYHFDSWSKKDFYKHVGIPDLNKKLILFGPPPYVFNNPYWDVLRYLDNLMSTNDLFSDFIVLVRFYPSDVIDIKSFISQRRLENCKNIYYSLPCTDNFGGGINWEFNKDDMLLLANSLYYSSQVINYGSTMTIDAAAFNKPSINIAFDGDSGQVEGGFQWVFDKTHILELLKTGGTRVANGYEELKSHLIEYAKNPSLDTQGRKKIIDRFCYKLDGQSSARLVKYLLDSI